MKLQMLKQINIISIIILLLAAFAQCRSFDSDEANRRLIQGKWRLVDAGQAVNDTAEINLKELKIFLTFKGDTCIQDLTGLKTTEYTFSIHNYILFLFKDSVFENKLEISALTEDSLIFAQDERRYWIYTKTEQ
jgi:hypothetical protein